MARQLRIEYPGAVYHVTSRGNARNDIYLNKEDRINFLATLDTVVRRFNWRCHAYCLMDNHYHLMIETPEGNLSKGMRQLNGVYTQLFNRRHGTVGHIFQGRFKAIVVEKDSYLLELCRYIVLNPVKAGMVRSPDLWEWSSHAATAGIKKAPGFLTTDWTLSQFGKTRKESQNQYVNFINYGMVDLNPWKEVAGGILLGKERFIKEMECFLVDRKTMTEIPRVQRYATRAALSIHFAGEEGLRREEKDARIYEAYVTHCYTLKEIADYLNIHYGTVSKAIKRVEQKNREGKT